MKRICLIIGATLGAAISVNAQNTNAPISQAKNTDHERIIDMVLNHSVYKSAAKLTSLTGQRLIAQSTYSFKPDSMTGYPTNEIGIVDSAAFIYIGNRPSEFNFNSMVFDRPLSYSVDLLPRYSTPVVSNPGVPFDRSINFSSNYYTPPYQYAYRDSFLVTYTADDKIQAFSDAANTYGLNLCNYNTAGQLTGLLSLKKTSSGYDTLMYTGYFYDGAGNKTADSIAWHTSGSWQPGELYLYKYDNDKLLSYRRFSFKTATNSWQEAYRMFVYYYADGRLKTDTMYNMTNGNAEWIDSFGWEPSLNYYTYRKRLSYGGGFYQFTDKKVNSNTSLPDTVYYSNIDFNGISRQKSRKVYTYTSDKQPLLSKEYFVSLTGNYDSLVNISHFYYQTYDTGSAGSPGSMSVYPNPATDFVIVSFSGVAAGSNISIRLINTIGQTAMRVNFDYQNTPQRITLPNLPTGIYWLEAEDKVTRKLHTQAILKGDR